MSKIDSGDGIVLESPCVGCELESESKTIEKKFFLRLECEGCVDRLAYVGYSLGEGSVHNTR